MMNARVFRGKNLAEARKTAHEILGDDSVVLTTRSVRRGGISGLFGGADVEIAATAAPSDEPASSRRKGPFAASAYAEPETAPKRDPLAVLRSELRGEIRAVRVALSRPTPTRIDRADELLAEVSAMREALELIAPASMRDDRGASVLRATGIEGGAATSLARALRMQGDGQSSVEEHLRDALSNLVTVAPWPLATESRAMIAVVGPAGVGKTTTIAKLAARARMEGRSVMLVTCDTFRVGAIEQTRRYADLLGAEFAIAAKAETLAGVLSRCRSDLVFVDTSGRTTAPDAAEQLLAAEAFGSASERARFTRHVLLCVTASTRAADASHVSKTFAHTEPTAIVVTKLDETETPAGLVHVPFAAKLPVTILCAGPRVPEDIAPATMGAILDGLTRRPVAKGVAA
jgi:flagellar biosynthesis protein FlhF